MVRAPNLDATMLGSRYHNKNDNIEINTMTIIFIDKNLQIIRRMGCFLITALRRLHLPTCKYSKP